MQVDNFKNILSVKAIQSWRIAPLIFAQLDEPEKQTSEYDEYDCLQKQTKAGIARQIAKHYQQTIVLHDLHRVGVNAILLKGSAFSEYIYTKDAPRLSNDIDILVKPSDWAKTVGYFSSMMQKMPKPVEDVFDEAYELSFSPKLNEQGYPVDVHMALTHDAFFELDYDGMWQRNIAHPVYEHAHIFCIEDNIIHQAIHCFKDLNFISYGLVDTHRLIEQPDFDPERLISLAKQSKTDIPLHYLFDALSQCSNEKVIKEIRNQTRPSWLRRQLCKLAIALEFSKDDAMTKSLSYRIKQIMFQLFFTRRQFQVFGLMLKYLFKKIQPRFI